MKTENTVLSYDICSSPKYDYENAPLAEYAENDIAWNEEMSQKMGKSFNRLRQSHAEVMKLAETFSDEELFSKGVYSWVGGSTLGSFIHTGMPHCDQACSVL